MVPSRIRLKGYHRLGPTLFSKLRAYVEQLALSATAHHLANHMEDFRFQFEATLHNTTSSIQSRRRILTVSIPARRAKR